jgi:hypothetical protein
MNIAKAFETLEAQLDKDGDLPPEVATAALEIAKQITYSLMSIAQSLASIAMTQPFGTPAAVPRLTLHHKVELPADSTPNVPEAPPVAATPPIEDAPIVSNVLPEPPAAEPEHSHAVETSAFDAPNNHWLAKCACGAIGVAAPGEKLAWTPSPTAA